MDYVRWRAEGDRVADDGASLRAHWEAAARRGNALARAKLDGPELPESVAYLLPWLYELHGRSGAHMAGLNPLSYTTVRDWATLTGRTLEPLEVEALIQLDAAMLAAYHDQPADEPADRAPAADAPWPERRHG